MAISRQKKEKILKNLVKKLKETKLLILLDYKGVSVSEVQNLRRKLRKADIEYFVTKKTLIKKALKENKINDLGLDKIKVPVSLVVTKKADPEAAKIIKGFQKETKKTKFLKGIFEGDVLDEDALKILADIPSREELLAKVVSSIASPISGLVYALKGNLTGLVSVLRQASEKK